MNIRLMQQEDVEQVAALESACFSQPWSRNAFQEVLSTSYRLVL